MPAGAYSHAEPHNRGVIYYTLRLNWRCSFVAGSLIKSNDNVGNEVVCSIANIQPTDAEWAVNKGGKREDHYPFLAQLQMI